MRPEYVHSDFEGELFFFVISWRKPLSDVLRLCFVTVVFPWYLYLHNWSGTRKKKGNYGFPVCGSSNVHARPLFGLQTAVVYLKLPQDLYYMSAYSKGSGETALMRRLARAFAGRQCDKYPFLICWLKLGFDIFVLIARHFRKVEHMVMPLYFTPLLHSILS